MKGETSGFTRNEEELESSEDKFDESEDTLGSFETELENSAEELEKSGNEFEDFEDSSEKSEITNGMRGAITGEIAVQRQRQAERTRRSRPVREMVRDVRERTMEREADFTSLRPAQEKVCDHNHLVDQRIIVTDAEDLGRTDFRFKLSERNFAQLVEYFEANGTTPSGAEVSNGKMVFESSKPKDDDPRGILEDYKMCDAYVFERKNAAGEKMKVFVAEPRKDKEVSLSASSTDLVRTAIGLVKIEAPREMSPEATEELLDQIMTEDFGIPDALEDVTVDDENDYKMVEYAKRIGKSPNKLTDAERRRAMAMKRVEIYPGYTELMDEGRHFEIEDKFGKVYVIHTMHTGNVDSVERLLKHGLLCSTERYARGVTVSGMSSEIDFHSGGADYVFTRAMTEEGLETVAPAGTTVVFKDELLDWMMTWYESDQFGATDEESRKKLMSTEELLEFIDERRQEGKKYPKTNEGMQPVGIGPQLIDQILVDSERQRREMVAELKKRGINEFDGRAIEDVILQKPSGDMTDDSVADELKDEEIDQVLAQADKEIEQMLKSGVLPKNDEFFGDDLGDDVDDGFEGGSGLGSDVDDGFGGSGNDLGYGSDSEFGSNLEYDIHDGGYGALGGDYGNYDKGYGNYNNYDDEDFGDELLGEDVSPYDF